MLWVEASLARKSSTCVRSTAVLAPSETTVENPTALRAAQSRMDAVSAPDWQTSASGPVAASRPAALALSLSKGRCRPRLFGPSRCMPCRRAIACRSAHSAAGSPVDSTSAARQRMRPAISSAAAMRGCGSAMIARSARDWARSDSVPVMSTSRKVSVPSNLCACSSRSMARASDGASSRWSGGPANTTIDLGENSGVRK